MKKIWFAIFLFVHAPLISMFNQVWQQTQAVHQKLTTRFSLEQQQYDQVYLTPGWRACQQKISQLLQGRPNPRFLQHETIGMTMLRKKKDFFSLQAYERNYLRLFLSKNNRDLLSQFQGSTIGGVELDMPEFNCGANELGQLYVFSKVLEYHDSQEINSILEWGGGYGCLARVAKTILPNVRYIIVDLIPLISLQYLYLSLTLPEVPLKVHYDVSTEFEAGYIHLVPFYLAEKAPIHSNIFISSFALTECPNYVQKNVAEKNFFGAQTIYVSGLNNALFNESNEFIQEIHDSVLLKSILKESYKIYATPHHVVAGPNVCQFELVAKK